MFDNYDKDVLQHYMRETLNENEASQHALIPSFRNKGSFDKAICSSVGQYASKKSSNLSKQIDINKKASYYERMTSIDLKRAMDAFATIIPTICSVIVPVLEVTYEI